MWPVAVLICAVLSSSVMAYYVKQNSRQVKVKATYYDQGSCRLPDQYGVNGDMIEQTESQETEIFFAGCSGYF